MLTCDDGLCKCAQGLATIRAFREQPAFIAVGRRLIDQSTRCSWPKLVCSRDAMPVTMPAIFTCFCKSYGGLCPPP